MRKSLFLIAAGGVFVIVSALPASAATSGRAEMTAMESAGPTAQTVVSGIAGLYSGTITHSVS